MVVPRFVRAALAERDLQVHGDGTQTRCFCHVSDTVRALAGLLDDERHFGEVFNVGSTEEVSIHALAQRVISVTGSSSSAVLLPYDEAYEDGFEDMMRRVPDIAKIGEALGWRPTRQLDEILSDVLTHETTKAVT